jgi:hypothetical protein
MKTKLLKSIAGMAVTAGCLAMPFSASALIYGVLGPAPYLQSYAVNVDYGSPGNVAPWYAWWNSLGTAVCVGPNDANCTGKSLGQPSGSWQTQISTHCSNGTGPNSGLKTNTAYTYAACAGWPLVVSTQGAFGVDAFPYGSTP